MCSDIRTPQEKYLLKALWPHRMCLKCQKLTVHGHKSCNCNGKKWCGNWIPMSVSFRSALTNPTCPALPSPVLTRAALGSCWRPGCFEGSVHVWVTGGAAEFLVFLHFLDSILVLQKGLFGSVILGQAFLKLCRNMREGFQSFSRSVNWEEMKQKGSLRSFTCWKQLGILRPSGRFWQGCVWVSDSTGSCWPWILLPRRAVLGRSRIYTQHTGQWMGGGDCSRRLIAGERL